MLAKTIVKKKTHEKVKQELLNTLREDDEVRETEINTTNIKDPIEAIERINCHEKIIKIQHKRDIGYICKQVEFLKKFKEMENVFDNAGQSRSTTSFKIGICKFFKKILG